MHDGLSRSSSMNSSRFCSPMKANQDWGRGSEIGLEGASQMTPRLNANNLIVNEKELNDSMSMGHPGLQRVSSDK